MAQATFTVLGNNVISNGAFSVRYVMDGDTPRFVLRDIVLDLGYKGVTTGAGTYWSKKLGGGKLYNSPRGQLVNCVTNDQVAELLGRRYKKNDSPITIAYLRFWTDYVNPRIAAEVEIQRLKAKIVSLETALKAREVA